MISNIFCPKYLKKCDLGLVKKRAGAEDRHKITLTLEGELPDNEEVNIYYSTYEADKP